MQYFIKFSSPPKIAHTFRAITRWKPMSLIFDTLLD